MIFEIVQHLRDSPVGSRPFVYERDDSVNPFANLDSTPVVVRQFGMPADRDVSQASFDIHVFTKGNPSNSDKSALFAECKDLQNWLLVNYSYQRIGNIIVTASPSGVYRDDQNRRYMTISIQAFRSSGG